VREFLAAKFICYKYLQCYKYVQREIKSKQKKRDMIKKTLSCTQRQKKHRIQVIQGHLKVHLHFDVVSDL
jgi:hypothetical protein